MAILQVVKGLNPGQQFPLEGTQSILGRHPDCHIVLDVGAVSRQHAQILRVGERYYLEDLHSRNGTLVNDQFIRGRYLLRDSDQVQICDMVFTFRQEPPGEDPTMARLGKSGGTMALVMDDDTAEPSSTVMSKLDIASSRSEPRLRVNAEAKLKALIEVTRNLGKAVALDDVLMKLLDSLFAIFPQADRGFIALVPTDGGKLVPRAIRHRRPDAEETIRISRAIVNRVMAGTEAILSADAANDARFDMSQSVVDFRIRSMMCAPLIDSEGRALGVIQIDTLDQQGRFQKDDLDVLASIASQAAIVVENTQLHETVLRQHAIQRDLELAHRVQRGFLPAAVPRLRGYEFFDFYEPANQVGGDWYSYIHLPGRRLAVVLADVSGKGISAALLMAKLSAEAHYCLVSEATPAEAVNSLNTIFAGSWEDRFVTLVLTVLDPARHEVTLVNAGHMPPLLRHANGTVVAIGDAQAGLPLGVDSVASYPQATFSLAPGDCLTLFTDGISEAMNAAGELYGLARLQRQVTVQASTILEFGQQILDDVKHFVGEQPQSDDMCLACFGRVAE
ncbi:MAG: SpoIIE family protein phosphatase [Pirellulales bacterium]